VAEYTTYKIQLDIIAGIKIESIIAVRSRVVTVQTF